MPKKTKEELVKPGPSPKNLPDLVFVVQFRDLRERVTRFAGRAEHVMSGQNTDFETPEELADFFERVMKPLFNGVKDASARDGDDRKRRLQALELRTRIETLTSRERQVLALLVTGLSNKQIAGELGTSDLAVKALRGRVMRKMAAGSLADLVQMTKGLKISSEPGVRSK
jgi:DNA-binding NarL/FixJ family response regulator